MAIERERNKVKRPRLDPYSLHEALDRAAMLSAMVDEYLGDHSAIKKLPKIQRKVRRAAELTAEAHQEIGTIAFETRK